MTIFKNKLAKKCKILKSYICSINIVTVIIKQFKYRKATATTRNLLKIITLNVYKTKLCFNNEVKSN